MNTSEITPTTNKVLVKPEKTERKTAGGIIIPDGAADRADLHQAFGHLAAIGPDAWDEFKEGGGSVGDRVVYAQYGGVRLTGADGETYQIMNDIDITCVVSEDVKSFKAGDTYE